MSDTVEKIYCTDNNDALLASVMGKNNNNPMAMVFRMQKFRDS